MLKKLILGFIGVIVFGSLILVAGVWYLMYHYSQGLPDYRQLANYEPPTTTRLHAADGRLMAEYAKEKRVFVPIEAMPRLVIRAVLSAEDQNFYVHSGVDFLGVVRAVVANIDNWRKGRRLEGASTITQQVAKNFLLSNEVSFPRKIREAILAFRIERTFSKDQILELYLNEVYLGMGSYGVAHAALNYFNKSLDELNIAEAAYLAALLKAPNNYHPVRHPEKALARRNWVIHRLLEEKYISGEEAEAAKDQPLTVIDRDETEYVEADYFAEEVRRELEERYHKEGLYEGGLSVRTTLDPALQKLAEKSLQEGLRAYDRDHGWRGPLGTLKDVKNWQTELAAFEAPAALEDFALAAVLKVANAEATIGFANGDKATIPFAEMKWARPALRDQRVGRAPSNARQILNVADVVAVSPTDKEGVFTLEQLPEVQGGIVAMDPHTGRVMAMVGGYSFADSVFNRATQAMRQPGSAFKPFVYISALDNGYTPATLILDAPFVLRQNNGKEWRPDNYDGTYNGPTPLRRGVERSRNLMTVRLAQILGMDVVAKYAERFGVVEDLPPYLPVSLGAGETTLLRMTAAYAMIVNGGKRIQPTLLDRVQDRHGRTIFRHDRRACRGCRTGSYTGGSMPALEDVREQIIDPVVAYQMVSILEGVVKRGTGRRIASLGRPLAGKTGTTNNNRDTWFIGFSPNLVVGVYVGFDQPRTLGRRATGSSVAAPIFKAFMAEALKERPIVPFRMPNGVRQVYVNRFTGRLASPGQENAILENFKPGTEPDREHDWDLNVVRGNSDPYTMQTGADPYVSMHPDFQDPGWGQGPNFGQYPLEGYGQGRSPLMGSGGNGGRQPATASSPVPATSPAPAPPSGSYQPLGGSGGLY